jgi:zinc transport system substrate-binding protein
VAPWATFAGLQVIGTYGPAPLNPGQLAELSAKKPGVVFENAHVPGGQALVEATGANKVELINFPPSSLNLLDVFTENARRILTVLGP